MNRVYTYLAILLMLTPYILMIVYPESLDFALNYFKKGQRFTYLIATFLFIFNITNYFVLTSEGRQRNLSYKHLSLVKTAMALNVILPTLIFLYYMRLDLAQYIFMASAIYSLLIYYGETRASTDKA